MTYPKAAPGIHGAVLCEGSRVTVARCDLHYSAGDALHGARVEVLLLAGRATAQRTLIIAAPSVHLRQEEHLSKW